MGEYLATPIKEKEIDEGEIDQFKFGACGMQGWRKGMEDAHLTAINVIPDVHVFGVFDGHGGQEVAIWVRENFVRILKDTGSFKKRDYAAALTETFLSLDVEMESKETNQQLKEIGKQKGSKKKKDLMDPEHEEISKFVGCTSVVALVTKTEIYVANAGDSRAVLASGGKAIALSEDHKPELEKERARIEAAGGFVVDNRVNGVLNLSRSLGDLEYKGNQKLKQEEQMITAFPDISIETLSAESHFLVLACDGIWDCINNDEIVKHVYDKLKDIGKDNTPTNIVTNLLDQIIAKDVESSGNIYIYIYIYRLNDDSFSHQTCATIGVDFVMKNLEIAPGMDVPAKIWDTAGQERFHTITHSFYKQSHGVLLVYDVTDIHTFDNIHNWLNNIYAHADKKIVKYLVGNKSDLTEKRAVSRREGEDVAQAYGMKYFETSACTGDNILLTFISLVRDIYSHMTLLNISDTFIMKKESVEKSRASSALAKRHCAC